MLKTRGIKGEIAAIPLSDDPERLKRVFVNGVELEIERLWWHQNRLIFKFRGIDSINDAEHLQNAEVSIPQEERAPLPDGEYYQSDLVGLEVVELGSGRSLGVVEGWQEYGGPALLVVKNSEGRELLIPFAKTICREIDVPGKRIGVELPEGLDSL